MLRVNTLPNGVRIVTEKMNTVRSAALGIWVGNGSRRETAEESGASHFIEHMLFKGTQNRSAEDIARETDAIGGQVNAFTTKECTCFYARALDTHLRQALDILWDMVYCSAFREEAVETERGVVLEEIDMYEDTPDDLCTEKLFGTVFAGSPLARPILGTEETLAPMTGRSLKAYHDTHYLAGETVVALSGSFSDEILKEIEDRFSALPAGTLPKAEPALYTPGFVTTEKTIEQNHLTLAFPGLTYLAPERFAQNLLSTMLGGGVSSRLFQQVREQQGLCYTIDSYSTAHEDTGVFNVYTALNRDAEAKAIGTICRVIRDFTKNGPTRGELERAREQTKANVIMGLESTHARMTNAGRALLFHDDIFLPEDIMAAYDAVTMDDIVALARRMFDFDRISLSAVGQPHTEREYRSWIE